MTETLTLARRDSGIELLDRVDLLFERGQVAAGTRQLFAGLDQVRATRNAQSWRRFADREAIDHPLRAKIHQDPMTRHSFDKPRGYAGDAELLDYIYGIRERTGVSPLGRTVGDVAASRAPAAAVRYRRDLIAFRLDQIAERSERPPRALSVACGHLREGRSSAALQSGGVEELVALDADPDSLRVVAASSPACVTPLQMSVRGLLADRHELGDFDFVYSAGLYDYLEDRVAAALTARLFALLRPGGRLLFCNFLPHTPDVGYMESFMGWRLLYRGLDAIERLAGEIDPTRIAGVRRYEDGFGSVGYVEVARAR